MPVIIIRIDSVLFSQINSYDIYLERKRSLLDIYTQIKKKSNKIELLKTI